MRSDRCTATAFDWQRKCKSVHVSEAPPRNIIVCSTSLLRSCYWWCVDINSWCKYTRARSHTNTHHSHQDVKQNLITAGSPLRTRRQLINYSIPEYSSVLMAIDCFALYLQSLRLRGGRCLLTTHGPIFWVSRVVLLTALLDHGIYPVSWVWWLGLEHIKVKRDISHVMYACVRFTTTSW